MSEENVELVRRWMRAFGGRDEIGRKVGRETPISKSTNRHVNRHEPTPETG
jgi:hypothetical protein